LEKIKVFIKHIFEYYSIVKFIAIFFAIVFISTILGMYFNNNIYTGKLIDISTIKQESVDALTNTIWQVQTAITTLTIATLALIVGMNKEKKYGLKLLNYLLILSPKIIKFHEKIILTILLVFVSYFFVAYQALAGVVFIFTINIFIIINMIITSVTLVLFEEKVELKMKNYILRGCKEILELENQLFDSEED
jgi:ABC-type multidrug transport system permease subunit